MNNNRAGADLEELMMFPKTAKVYSRNKTTSALICKGLHQNTLIKQSTTLIEQSWIYLV